MFFSLLPFTPLHDPSDLRIMVQLSRRSNAVDLSYAIHGPVKDIILPVPAERPDRKQGLWEETCLEAFLALKDAQQYWEINLSPSGHWNVYRFSAYREGMQEETAFTSLPFRAERGDDSFHLDVELDLNGIITPPSPLHVGVSAVIQLRTKQMSYWALTHPGQKPDFHLRESFVARL